jgi:hypothetical protein
MPSVRVNAQFAVAIVLTVLGWAVAGVAVAAETSDAVTITVQNASARIGEKATVVATITPRAGYQIADTYRNRITTLSAADDGIEFTEQVVRGSMQNGGLVFRVGVVPRKAGAHAINGVVRFAFVNSLDGDRHLDIKWVPLMATVTGRD